MRSATWASRSRTTPTGSPITSTMTTTEVSRAAPRFEDRWRRVRRAFAEYASDPAGRTEGVARAVDDLTLEAKRLLDRVRRPRRFRLPWR